MVGIVVVSHGDLANAYVNAAVMLVGEPEQLSVIGIYPGDSPKEIYSKIEQCIKDTDTGDGVIALVDLYGGTPNNTVARLSREYNVRILTGANLPMVMYAIVERTDDMTQQDLVDGFLSTGIEGIAEFAVK